MTILDANILLYAYAANAPQHPRVRAWLDRLWEGAEPVGISWLALWAFVRISTNPKLSAGALAQSEAFEIVREVLAPPRASLIGPGARHAEILERAAVQGQATGPKLTDAVFAALAIEYGATLASTDRDFARFPGLHWVNPLDS